jgi:hypothetical protein
MTTGRTVAMTSQQSDAIRAQLQRVYVLIRPYVHSVGPFHDAEDIKEVIRLSMHALETADRLLNP